MSGFIGIAIYASVSQEQFEDQNKFFYTAIGLPIWLIIRQLYWKSKVKRVNDQLSSARELLDKYGSPERATEVAKFNFFGESYKRILTEDKNSGEISEAEFKNRLKALVIVGTEILVGRYLTNEEIDKLVGYEEHISSVKIIRSLFDTTKG